MGAALKNLGKLLHMPTGCGEQNMVGFTPNVYVLLYLSEAQKTDPKLTERAIKYMEIGNIFILFIY